MNKSKIMHKAFTEVFSSRNYMALGIASMLIWIVLGVAFTNVRSISNSLTLQAPLALRLEILYHSLLTSLSVYDKTTAFFLLATAILVAINVPLMVYSLRKTQVNPSSPFGFAGLVTGTISSTCAACATSLVSLLGLSGAILALPFRGAEIGVLTLALLSFSLYRTSVSVINAKVCRPTGKVSRRK
ncbi:MAG: hypothetical protein HYS53_00860 [Candidatus Aenigmarchaeota archaeon]|nr:hypothetical protein [Candidatus Aenigmarchaeota archaeon]